MWISFSVPLWWYIHCCIACREKKHERLPGPLNQDASKVPYSLHVPSDWANQVYKSNNRKTCVQTTMKSAMLLTSFTSCLLETNVHLLEHSGNNGHHCEESSSKYVCINHQWHQSVFMSHHPISEPNWTNCRTCCYKITFTLKTKHFRGSLSKMFLWFVLSLIVFFLECPFRGTALIFCRWIRYISAETTLQHFIFFFFGKLMTVIHS